MNAVDSEAAKNHISHLVDSVTCLECCKYYIAPETAQCGHSLCHICWYSLRHCPHCKTSLDKRSLKLNTTLQNLTGHIQECIESFEHLFNVKMDFEKSPNNKEGEHDHSKTVKNWLTSSQNHFSAPPYDTQQSTQDPPAPILLSTSKIQIYAAPNKTTSKIQNCTDPNKTRSPAEVVVTQNPQADWDKIEIAPEPGAPVVKEKENIVGPMDLEPFDYDENNEYSNDHPRRSTRKRDSKNSSVSPLRKSYSKNSANYSLNTEKKIEQSWTSVKKMKKEFSKLNKQNKNKLDVSIEACKKVPTSMPNQTPTEDPNLYNIIEDATPSMDVNKHSESNPKESKTMSGEVKKKSLKLTELKQTVLKNINTNTRKSTTASGLQEDIIEEMDIGKNQPSKSNASQSVNQSDKDELKVKETADTTAKIAETVGGVACDKATSPTMPTDKCQSDANIHIDANAMANMSSTNAEDIQISIRIGSLVTNIVINRKLNDVVVQTNRDREVQTSLGPYAEKGSTVNVQTASVDDLTGNGSDKSNKPLVGQELNKSKKNTDSAETVTAQFEITESVEKEMSINMECLRKELKEQDSNKLVDSQKRNQKLTSTSKNITSNEQKLVKPREVTKIQDKLTQLYESRKVIEIDSVENIEFVDDIFNSGSVKEVQLLKNAGHAPSEILMPTHRTNKTNRTRTQKLTEKRLREVDDAAETQNKKRKGEKNDDKFEENEENESVNYDDILGHAFANIDADLDEIQQSQSQKIIAHNASKTSSTTKLTQRAREKEDEIKKTQIVNRVDDLKYSENMFSITEKQSQIRIVKEPGRIPGPETQSNIDNLLTPGMCRDLISPQEDEAPAVQATPVARDDDDDKSVFEETPQKSRSNSNLKARDISLNRSTSKHEKQHLSEKVTTAKLAENNSLNSQDIGSIIHITDTNKDQRNTEALGKSFGPRETQTPLTIDRFVDRIKHNSTPLSRKSIKFTRRDEDENDVTLCPSVVEVAKTTQERAIMREAFQSQSTPVRRPLSAKKAMDVNKRLVIAGSCLTPAETSNLRQLCERRKWVYVNKYVPELTHLVVAVDEENKSQRSVKYMCALAGAKWIVGYKWVQKCLELDAYAAEEPFEAVDSTGDPGPRRSRLAHRKLFEHFTFLCQPPFSVLDLDTIEIILTSAGGRVVHNLSGIHVTSGAPALLLAEPEDTQDYKFTYMAVEKKIVPVNFEWALNCLGSYTLLSLTGLLLCPTSLLPPQTASWPQELLASEEY